MIHVTVCFKDLKMCFDCMYVMYTCIPGAYAGQRSYKWFEAAKWVLGTELGSSAGAACAQRLSHVSSCTVGTFILVTSDLLRQPTIPLGSAGWRGQFWGACPQGRCERSCFSLLFTNLTSPRSELLLR